MSESFSPCALIIKHRVFKGSKIIEAHNSFPLPSDIECQSSNSAKESIWQRGHQGFGFSDGPLTKMMA